MVQSGIAASEATSIRKILQEAAREWWEGEAPTRAAGVAFYMVFSLAPIFMITVAIGSMIYGREGAREEIFRSIATLAGGQVAAAARAVLEQARVGSFLATVVGVLTSVIGATAALAAMQSVINQVWDVEIRAEHFVSSYFRHRAISFALILAAGPLLLIVPISRAIASRLIGRLERFLNVPSWLLVAAHLVFAVLLITLIFAALYKYLPDAKVRWRAVWVGAFGTALLFTLGNALLGLYLRKSTLTSVYGVAGSMVLILLWVYYTVQIVIFGAEFTHVYARLRGIPIEPVSYARRRNHPLRIDAGGE